jgi:hypothetical protein
MTKYSLFVIIIALRIGYQPILPQQGISPFASPATTTAAKLISVNASIDKNRVFIDWTVDENETVYQFEIEKSNDGKNFTTAALVFGSDKPATDNYRFYEKAGKKKVTYRIKIINKNQQTEYSSVVEVAPKA